MLEMFGWVMDILDLVVGQVGVVPVTLGLLLLGYWVIDLSVNNFLGSLKSDGTKGSYHRGHYRYGAKSRRK